MGSPKGVKGPQTSSALGGVSHEGALHFIDALGLGRAGSNRVNDLKRQVLNSQQIQVERTGPARGNRA